MAEKLRLVMSLYIRDQRREDWSTALSCLIQFMAKSTVAYKVPVYVDNDLICCSETQSRGWNGIG